LADTGDAPRFGHLKCPRGFGLDDPVLHYLSLALVPTFERQHEANRLFVDYVTLAITAHVARTYGDIGIYIPRRGGLAPWQERRAKELIDANLEGNISQEVLARECGLSPSHFARAFRVTLGEPPHRWLLRRRIDRAKVLMMSSTATLAEIAVSCGFADQGHFTRTFNSIVGTPPGTWRRLNRH
jgi:transcriptional regulator GlxA family with amidase domain